MREPLVLAEASTEAWSAFMAGAAPRVDAGAPPVAERWARSWSLGVSPEGPPDDAYLLRGAALRIRQEEAPLLHGVADGALAGAAGVVSAHDFVLVVADAAGTVVSTVGGGAFADDARRLRLIEGASWSEAARGTNAIGTALAEERPVHVLGSAHFARRFHELVCYAAPIFDAAGAVVGVIDATSRLASAHAAVGTAVRHAAAAAEQALRAHAYAVAGRSVTQVLARALDHMAGPALLVEAPGRVARVNAAARAQVGAVAVGDVATVLGVRWDALRAAGLTGSREGIEVCVGAGRRRARVEPIVAADGRVLAALVFLEASSSSPVPARPAAIAPSGDDPFAAVFAEDAAVRAAIAWARRIAPSGLPVMLLAETGGGKELVARAVHRASARAARPFCAINCGALAPTLLESELFGHGPSAFTGAGKRGRDGLLAAADGGTLFLDEVAEMSPSMQAALLRVLEDGTYRRVGETEDRVTDVRVLCATCRDLDALVASGAFRRDLFFRLAGARVVLPPLRDRTDVPALASHLLGQLAAAHHRSFAPSISEDVAAALAAHRWPGNVRELRSTLEVALVLAGDAPEVTLDHLPPGFCAPAPSSLAPAEPAELARAEAGTVQRVLAEVAGNVSVAAKRLGVARSTVYRIMRRHGLRDDE